jgi:hypothetical protein
VRRGRAENDIGEPLYEDSLAEALQPATPIDYNRRATGEKFLINRTKVF